MANGIDILSDTTGQAIVESIKALGNKIGGNTHHILPHSNDQTGTV